MYGSSEPGNVACRNTSSAPRKKPPSTAPRRLPSPPITEAMNASITGTKPVVGLTEVVRAIHSTPAMPASNPEIRKASEITPFARTPSAARS